MSLVFEVLTSLTLATPAAARGAPPPPPPPPVAVPLEDFKRDANHQLSCRVGFVAVDCEALLTGTAQVGGTSYTLAAPNVAAVKEGGPKYVQHPGNHQFEIRGAALGTTVYGALGAGGYCVASVVTGNQLSTHCKVGDVDHLLVHESGEWKRLSADGAGDGTPPGVTPPIESPECNDYGEYEDDLDVCVEVDANRLIRVTLPPGLHDHVIGPNTPLRVFAVFPEGFELQLEWQGQAGTYEPSNRNSVDDSTVQVGTVPPPKWTHYPKSFSSRLPGSSPLEIRVQGPDGKETEDSVELTVEKTYVGSFRLGIGVVTTSSRYANREYHARKPPGSQVSEIVATDAGQVDFELVLGFAPYVFDAWEKRPGAKRSRLVGRGYVDEDSTWRAGGIAPYIGLGLLEVQKNAVQAFKSLHLGLEWEPMPHVSIAATFVLRRVERLGSGYAIGMPVAEDPPTRQLIAPAFGIVLNLSPEFFKLARRSSSSFFGGT